MTDHAPRKFYILLALISLFYLAFEFWFNQYAMLSVDEFWFAHRIYEFNSGLPYKDFSPYKTVLGYYLLLLPMTVTNGIFNTLIVTKNFLAVCNTLVLFSACCYLTRFFSRSGVICSALCLISMEIMLSYSTQIRVDLPAYWFCLFSLLLLLDRRFIVAGLLLGLGFSTSQKAIWYLFACNAALGVHWLMSERSRQYFFSAVKFNLAALSIIIAYLMLWSLAAGAGNVFQNVFIEASAMYHLDWYDASRPLYWYIILLFNPLPFLLWPLTLISLMISFPGDRSYAARRFAIVAASVILLCLIGYKQVFPYYMQVTLPCFLVLYAAFFTWLTAYLNSDSPVFLISKQRVTIFLTAYSIAIAALITVMHLPYPYLLLTVIPFTLLFPAQRILLLAAMIFTGLIYPMSVYVVKLISIDGSYQQANIAAVNTLLNYDADYTAGIELIYNKTQRVAGLRHLMGPAIDYLYQPSEKIRPVMTAALYEDPDATAAGVVDKLRHSRVKFYVNNYRMQALPPVIKDFLAQDYQHWWGSVYLYAPRIAAGRQKTQIKFAGEYHLQTTPTTAVIINGKAFKNGAQITLPQAEVITISTKPFRLKLLTDVTVDPAFTQDAWEKMIF